MVDAAAQPEWTYVISKESIAIVAAALATRPDLVFLHRLHNALLAEKAGGRFEKPLAATRSDLIR